jgi:hypothetical protein
MNFGCSVLLICILSYEFWMFCITNMYTVVCILDIPYFEHAYCRMHFDVLYYEYVYCRIYFWCSVLPICILSYAFLMFCITNMYTVVCILDILYFQYVYCRMHVWCSVLLICILSYAFWMFCVLNMYTAVCIFHIQQSVHSYVHNRNSVITLIKFICRTKWREFQQTSLTKTGSH